MVKNPLNTWSAIIDSPIGWIGINTQHDKLTGIHFLPPAKKLLAPQDQLTKRVADELQLYFKNATHTFSLEIFLDGSTHQKAVWQALKKIPRGETRTYGELASTLQSHARAIGQACKRNPVAIVIPCHRVVAKTSLGGFAGKESGRLIDIKRWLLAHEEKIKK